MEIPNFIKEILDKLENGGFEGFIVGGCLRDSLLKKTPKDWDITTNATPQEIKEVFNDYSIFTIGEKYGTIGVISPLDPLKQVVEITTYRYENSYNDLRHPSEIRFVSSLLEDLKRRDFSINSIAYHYKQGFIDPYRGIKDIENKNITCIGNPSERFSEDPLRILRALRFKSRLQFSISPTTLQAIWKDYPLLHKIAKERIVSELYQILQGDFSKEVLIEFENLLKDVLGAKVKTPLSIPTKFWANTTKEIRLTYILVSYFDTQKSLEDFLKTFKFPNRTSNCILFCMQHKGLQSLNRVELKTLLCHSSIQNVEFLLDFLEVYGTKSFHKEKSIFKEILENEECYCLKQLAINGKTLQKMGVKNGVQIGKILEQTLQKVIKEELPNQKEALECYALSLNALI